MKVYITLLFMCYFSIVMAQSAHDTVISKIHYAWVKYDLNLNPYEIGETYKDGIKNGNWLYRDQQGRLSADLHYLNDTLNGAAVYYYHLNPPEVVKFEGLLLRGKKTGVWVSSTSRNKFGGRYSVFTLTYDNNERLLSRTYLHKNGRPKMQIYYSENEKEIWYRYYKRNGKLYKEDNKNPWVIMNL